MPGQRRFGMDHEHYDWSPIVKRPPLRWPEGARVALCVVVNLEHWDWVPPQDSYRPPNMAGVQAYRPFPDYVPFSWREYGHRVGIFRVMDALDRHGIKATVAMDALTAENYPMVTNECLQRGWEFIAHGVAATRMITSQMSEQEERAYIQRSVDSLRKATGRPVLGWLGPEYGESVRTPQLVSAAGIRYICDWVNDEQPYPMKSPTGELYSLPITLELDDGWSLWTRRISVMKYGQNIRDGFDTLYSDGAHTGRLLVLHLHPWIIGQPFRIKYLREALAHIMARQGVWAATGSEIIEWYRSQHSS